MLQGHNLGFAGLLEEQKWLLVAVFPCFPHFSLFSLITAMVYARFRALSSICVRDCWWDEEEGASLSSGAIKEPKSHFFLHLISRCEPQLQLDLSRTGQSPAGCQSPVQGRAGARHTQHSPGQLSLCQPQQHGQIWLPGTTPGPSRGAASLLPHHPSC